jgi:heptosyltransferase II
MGLPALKRVRQLFPRAQITLLVSSWVSGLYDEFQCADELLIYDREKEHRGIAGRLKIVRVLQKRGFDAALLFQNAFDAALLARLAKIPIRAGYNRDGRGWLLTHPIPIDPRINRLHQTYYYLDLIDQLVGRDRIALRALEAPVKDGRPSSPMPDISISLSSERKEIARLRLQEQGVDLQKKLIGVNPGAFYGSAKRWFSDRYAQLLDRLIEHHGVEVALFGSPGEVPIAHSIRSFMRHRPVILSGKTQLSELIAMIACCDLFITNDSGPMHLAAALRVPTLAIFGPTDEVATGPLSPTAVVLKKAVECSPCLLRECPIDHRCMTRMTVDEVYRQATQLFTVRC